MPVKFPDRLRNLNIFSAYSLRFDSETEKHKITVSYVVFLVFCWGNCVWLGLLLYVNCDVRIRVYRFLMKKRKIKNYVDKCILKL